MVSKKGIEELRSEQAELFSQERDTKKLIAKDAMIKPVLLFPDDNTGIILKKLRKENINVCIVVDKEKKFLGEIGDGDIISLFLKQVKHEPLVKILNIGYKREFNYKTAKEMMNRHKSTVELDTPINKVIELVYKEGFQYIPVTDKNKKVLGVITPSSIINLLRNY